MKLAALVLALLASTSSLASSSGPVAVMPFKNLAGSGELDWLKLGIAETLLADLANDGGRPVVERDQIDRALAEVMLQEEQSSEDGVAAKAGRLVGATTVVVGGFQQVGTQLRITARFVAVETGVVEDTAKVTGALVDIFALQDQIVARLLKKPVKARPPKSKPKPPASSSSSSSSPTEQAQKTATPEQTVEAYQAYSLSLSTSSEAERVRYLKESIALDPDFAYALQDLKKLEQRLEGYRRESSRVLDNSTRGLLVLARDPARPAEERAVAVMQAFGSYTSTFRYQALGDVAAAIYALKMPSAGMMDPHEMASFNIFFSSMMLKQTDLALQAGERHLKEFPGTGLSATVDLQMNNLIEDRRRKLDAQNNARDELKKIDDEEVALPSTTPSLPLRKAMFAFRRCSAVYRGRLYDDAVGRCRAYAIAHPSDEPQHLDELARYFAAMSLAELGRFADARADLQQLQREDEAWARSMGIPSLLSTWPRD